jgi:hypothetical protein
MLLLPLDPAHVITYHFCVSLLKNRGDRTPGLSGTLQCRIVRKVHILEVTDLQQDVRCTGHEG